MCRAGTWRDKPLGWRPSVLGLATIQLVVLPETQLSVRRGAAFLENGIKLCWRAAGSRAALL